MQKPQYYSVVSGQGTSNYALVAFDNALRQAGIGDYNLVKVSSILPPGCIYKEHINLEKGSIMYAAYATATVIEGEMKVTAVAAAIPEDDKKNGVIFEHVTETQDAEKKVRDMCLEAMNNRNRSIKEIKSSSLTIYGEKDKYVCSISAIVMW